MHHAILKPNRNRTPRVNDWVVGDPGLGLGPGKNQETRFLLARTVSVERL
jgi:hypothetical protein